MKAQKKSRVMFDENENDLKRGKKKRLKPVKKKKSQKTQFLDSIDDFDEDIDDLRKGETLDDYIEDDEEEYR